jgi:hypothetical protein
VTIVKGFDWCRKFSQSLAIATFIASCVVANGPSEAAISPMHLESLRCFSELADAKPDPRDKTESTKTEGGSYIACDYSHAASFNAAQLTLEVSGSKTQLDRKNITRYPAKDQKTAILAIFDVSDPRRSRTTTSVYPSVVTSLIGSKPKHVSMGVATFSSSLAVVLPVRSLMEPTEMPRETFAASGASTELYRAALSGIQILASEKADRRVLVIVSDGKSEDTAYGLGDVVNSASNNRVPIVAIGISERASESPSLQSLRVLAERTGGVFLDLSNKTVPADLQSTVLSSVEAGGRLRFDASRYFGMQRIKVVILDANKSKVELTTDFVFPDTRSAFKKIQDFFREYWWALLGGVVGLAIVGLGITRVVRDRRQRASVTRLIAELRGLDSTESVFEVRKPVITIGRALDSDIVLANSSVSSRHAELHKTRDGGVKLIDLGSTNGTLVNGSRIVSANLQDGDVLEIAEVRLQFRTVN